MHCAVGRWAIIRTKDGEATKAQLDIVEEQKRKHVELPFARACRRSVPNEDPLHPSKVVILTESACDLATVFPAKWRKRT